MEGYQRFSTPHFHFSMNVLLKGQEIFLSGTEIIRLLRNCEGRLVGDWEGLSLDRSKLFWVFVKHPNKIQTNHMVEGVVQFCQQDLSMVSRAY